MAPLATAAGHLKEKVESSTGQVNDGGKPAEQTLKRDYWVEDKAAFLVFTFVCHLCRIKYHCAL